MGMVDWKRATNGDEKMYKMGTSSFLATAWSRRGSSTMQYFFLARSGLGRGGATPLRLWLLAPTHRRPGSAAAADLAVEDMSVSM